MFFLVGSGVEGEGYGAGFADGVDDLGGCGRRGEGRDCLGVVGDDDAAVFFGETEGGLDGEVCASEGGAASGIAPRGEHGDEESADTGGE